MSYHNDETRTALLAPAARRKLEAQRAAAAARHEARLLARREHRTYAEDTTLDAQRAARTAKRRPKRLHGRGTPWVGFVPSRFTHTPGPRPGQEDPR